MSVASLTWSTIDRLPGDIMEETSRTDDSTSGETDNDESSDMDLSDDEKIVSFPGSETDKDDEATEVALWGKIGSRRASEPLAVYWSFDGDDNKESDNKNELLDESFIISLANEDVGTSEFDSSLERERYLEQILSHSVSDSAVPQATIDQYQSQLESYINETRVDWLIDFVRNQDENQIKNWIEPLLDQFFQGGGWFYQINVAFAEDNDSIKQELSKLEENDDTEETLNPEPEDENDDSTIDVSFITDPSSGIRAPDLQMGEDVYFRILEPAVEKLTEDMIDRERSNPASIPLVGRIVGIQEKPELDEQIDGDPEDYRLISVEVESSVRGKGLVFKENRIKVEDGTTDSETGFEKDLIFLGAILGILMLIIALLLVL